MHYFAINLKKMFMPLANDVNRHCWGLSFTLFKLASHFLLVMGKVFLKISHNYIWKHTVSLFLNSWGPVIGTITAQYPLAAFNS